MTLAPTSEDSPEDYLSSCRERAESWIGTQQEVDDGSISQIPAQSPGLETFTCTLSEHARVYYWEPPGLPLITQKRRAFAGQA